MLIPFYGPLHLLAPRGGFEPPACPLGGDRSILLSYRGIRKFYHKPQYFMLSFCHCTKISPQVINSIRSISLNRRMTDLQLGSSFKIYRQEYTCARVSESWRFRPTMLRLAYQLRDLIAFQHRLIQQTRQPGLCRHLTGFKHSHRKKSKH
jgi:hypothetical protein